MRVPMVEAPASLLFHRDLTATAKVLWLAARLHSAPVAPAGLAASTGLTLPTIRKGLARLETTGWHSPSTGAIEHSPSDDARASIPVSLLSDRRVRPQARLLYGILQTRAALHDKSGEFTYSTLSASARLSVITVRQVVRELAETGWLQLTQANQLAPIRFTLRIPELDRSAAEAALAMRRLEEADHRGEAIMREYLSLLIDSDEFEDNARPGFLANPLTDERMELDRYYPPEVAFEFNGPQHYRVTPHFPSGQALATQQARDLIKEALCTRRGIRIVVITREDLTLEIMRQKVGALLPLRDLRGHAELIALLEKVSKPYRS